MKDRLLSWLRNQGIRVVEIQKALVSIPALGPENGGNGEYEKALFIKSCLDKLHIENFMLEAPDARVKSGIRPNIIAKLPGRHKRKLWLFGHLDVVPPGDPEAWKTNPWALHTEGDLIYGRGVEDNQQAVASMLILAEGLKKLDIQPELTLGFVFMADEECGSNYGLKWLLDHKPDLFSENDYFIVPDGGSPVADIIEIAEKAQLWLKFLVLGKQCHASMPENGVNAFTASSALVLELLSASTIFDGMDKLFVPPVSTFVPTMHEKNVSAINILPGKDIFFMDCRLLPGEDKEEVLNVFQKACRKIEAKYKVKVEMQIVHYQKGSMTSTDSSIIKLLTDAVIKQYHVSPHPVGIGGATVAAMLRDKGLHAIVWSCIFNSCHQPNEHSSISATLNDACVFARILMQDKIDEQQ